MVAGSLKYDTKLDSDGFKKGLSKLEVLQVQQQKV